MGIALYLIDQRSPRAFTMAFPENDRVNQVLRMERPQMQPPLRRPRPGTRLRDRDERWSLFSLVASTDMMAAVVTAIVEQYSSARLDLIRIEAHGRLPEALRPANHVQFGASMEAADVGCFSRVAALWSRPYSGSPASAATRIDQVFPRIEFHSCQIVPGCNAMLQALANAAMAYVYASSSDQDVDLRPGYDRYAIEPPVFRFHPGGTAAQRV